MPLDDFDTLKARKEKMLSEHSDRNDMFYRMERAYKITPEGSGQGADAEGNTSAVRARKLFDPHPHNVIDRIVQMYTTNAPSVDVPVGNADKAKDPVTAEQIRIRAEAADKVQEVLKALLRASDETSEKSLIADLLFAGGIYGEIPAIIDNQMATPGYSAEDGSPFLFEVAHPVLSYPRYRRRGGLYQHLFQLTSTVGQVRQDYGTAADWIDGEEDDEVTINDYMDRFQHVVWLDEYAEQPILSIPFPPTMRVMPRVSRIVSSAPGFMEKEVDRRMPFLYSMVKSGLWAARNTALTAMQTNVIDFLNPKMLWKMQAGRQAPMVDWSKRGDSVTIEAGEGAEPFPFRSIPPELLQFNALVELYTQQSTMNPISGGTAPGGVFSASGLNLLATASRLATFSIARSVESTLSQMLTRTLKWIEAGDYRPEIFSGGSMLSLTPADIAALGKFYTVRVVLKPDQQAERMMVAALARSLKELSLGFEDYLRPLEEGQVIESVSAAMENMKRRAMIEAELPKIAQQSAAIGEKLVDVVKSIPEMPEALQQGMAAQGGMPPMAMPEQAMGAPTGEVGMPQPIAPPNLNPGIPPMA